MYRLKPRRKPPTAEPPFHREIRLSLSISFFVALGVALLSPPSVGAQEPAWNLIWADEFDQPDGSAPDASRWAHDSGGDGWGNNELQTYTNRRTNSWIENGRLVIAARKEQFTGNDNRRREYTSARLKTQGLVSWTYGRFEARMKLPRGPGIWPAFWMLGTNITSVGWPTCGEIDILENIGREPRTVHGTIHGPGYSGADGIGRGTSLPANAVFADDFHLYAVEWTTNRIRWSVDNVTFFTATPASLPAGRAWVFTAPQFLLLNLAVGGNWPGNPDATTVFPQRYEIDYVRVYAATNMPPPRVQATVLDGRAVIGWLNSFPQARLEYAASLPPLWRGVALSGRMRSGQFEEPAETGFYRLRWSR